MKSKRIIIPAITAFFLLAAIGSWEVFMKNRLAYGAIIGGLELGGLSISQAEKILNEKLSQYEIADLTFLNRADTDNPDSENKEKSYSSNPAILGIKFDINGTLTESAGPFWTKSALIKQIETLILSKEIPLKFSFNEERLNNFFDEISQTPAEPPQNAFFNYDSEKKELTVIDGHSGIAAKKEKFIANLTANLSRFKNETIILEFSEQAPTVIVADLSAIKPAAEKIISQTPFTIKAGNWQDKLDAPTIAPWLTASLPIDSNSEIKLAFDKKRIKVFLENIAPQVNQEPINAKLVWAEGKINSFSISQDGRKIEIEASVDKIISAITAGQTEIELAYDTIPPKITSDKIDMLGLTTLLGQGESNFVGSPANRKHNIAVGAAKLNGLLIEPGEEFSFVQSIGEIDGTTGYLLELVIKVGKTIPEYGGGICQVSTTLFRAAVNSGLKITARSPHAIPIRYYNPPGFDATIYPPKPDLKFINDTENNILLQSKIIGTKLIFEIYGTSDGRQVKIIGPKTLSSNPDGSMKTILTQQIWRDGTLAREAIFRSSYKSPSLYPIITASPTPSPTPTASVTPSPSATPSTTPSATPSPTPSL